MIAGIVVALAVLGGGGWLLSRGSDPVSSIRGLEGRYTIAKGNQRYIGRWVVITGSTFEIEGDKTSTWADLGEGRMKIGLLEVWRWEWRGDLLYLWDPSRPDFGLALRPH